MSRFLKPRDAYTRVHYTILYFVLGLKFSIIKCLKSSKLNYNSSLIYQTTNSVLAMTKMGTKKKNAFLNAV